MYTKSECLDDLRNFANENHLTRNNYRNSTHIPQKDWVFHFGTWKSFCAEAGLSLSKFERAYVNSIARHASLDKLKEVSEERKSFSKLYPKREDHSSRFKTLIAASDFHDISCDPFYFRVLEETCKIVEPDVICLNGDIFDLPEFSKYYVDPRDFNLVGRIKAGLELVSRLRNASPNSQIDLIEGNHEARILKHLHESSPGMQILLNDLHGIGIRDILGLDKYEVNYIGNCDLATFTQRELDKEVSNKNYKIYWNSVLAHHEPEGMQLGVPGFNGHHHKYTVHSLYNATYGSYTWHQLGSGHKRSASYTNGLKWNNGFMICHIDTVLNKPYFEYVDVGTSLAVSVGNFYYRKDEEYYEELTRESL